MKHQLFWWASCPHRHWEKNIQGRSWWSWPKNTRTLPKKFKALKTWCASLLLSKQRTKKVWMQSSMPSCFARRTASSILQSWDILSFAAFRARTSTRILVKRLESKLKILKDSQLTKNRWWVWIKSKKHQRKMSSPCIWSLSAAGETTTRSTPQNNRWHQKTINLKAEQHLRVPRLREIPGWTSEPSCGE